MNRLIRFKKGFDLSQAICSIRYMPVLQSLFGGKSNNQSGIATYWILQGNPWVQNISHSAPPDFLSYIFVNFIIMTGCEFYGAHLHHMLCVFLLPHLLCLHYKDFNYALYCPALYNIHLIVETFTDWADLYWTARKQLLSISFSWHWKKIL